MDFCVFEEPRRDKHILRRQTSSPEVIYKRGNDAERKLTKGGKNPNPVVLRSLYSFCFVFVWPQRRAHKPHINMTADQLLGGRCRRGWGEGVDLRVRRDEFEVVRYWRTFRSEPQRQLVLLTGGGQFMERRDEETKAFNF